MSLAGGLVPGRKATSMSETFDRWTDNRNEHEAGLMDSGLYDPPGEPPEDDVALEMELARWRRENPLPEPEDDGRPW